MDYSKSCLVSTVILHVMLFLFMPCISSTDEKSNDLYFPIMTKSNNRPFYNMKNEGWYPNGSLNINDDNGKLGNTVNITNNHEKNSQMSRQESIATELMEVNEINIIPKIIARLLPIHTAIINGQNNELVNLLNDHQVVNERTYNNLTLLHLAAIYNNYEAVSILIEHNADILAVTTGNLTSLHIASIYGSSETAELLIKKNVLVSMKAANNLTPLHFAAASNSIIISLHLVENNAFIDATDKNQQTPFYIALKYNNKELAYTLSHKGANVNLLLENDTTLLHLAVQKGDQNAINLLLTFPDIINKIDLFESSALHFAALYGRSNACRILLENGADIFARNIDDNMPIHLAAQNGFTDVLAILLEHNTSLINVTGYLDYTPLHCAVSEKQTETIRFLLSTIDNINATANYHNDSKGRILPGISKYKPDVFAKDEDGNMPIHLAAQNGLTDAIATLLEYSPSLIDATGQMGFTPLHNALYWKQSETIRFLLSKVDNRIAIANYHNDSEASKPLVILKYKPNIFAKDVLGNMPIHLAAENGFNDAIAILLEHGPSLINAKGRWGVSPLHYAVLGNQTETINFLLSRVDNINATANYHDSKGRILPGIPKCKPDVFVEDDYGRMPIHFAAHKGFTYTVDIFLQACPRLINATGTWNFTPLHWAIMYKKTKTINFLLSTVDNINLTANYHNESEQSKLPVILKYKPDIFAKDIYGDMPIHLAAMYGLNDVVHILLMRSPSLFNKKTHCSFTPIYISVMHNHSEITLLLLRNNANLSDTANDYDCDDNSELSQNDQMSFHKESPVQLFDMPEIFKNKMIIDIKRFMKNANISKPVYHVKEPKGTKPSITVLHLAAQKGLANILRIILKYKPDIFAKDRNGDLPIHKAASSRSATAVCILLKKNSSLINATGYMHYTPLHYAVHSPAYDEDGKIDISKNNVTKACNEEVLCTLLQHGADRFAKDKRGYTPIDLAEMFNETVCLNILNGFNKSFSGDSQTAKQICVINFCVNGTDGIIEEESKKIKNRIP